MKALSLIQPFASLIVDGKKTVETRSWPTAYRGSLAIHASKKVDQAACAQFGYDPRVITRGAVLGTADLVDCAIFPDPRMPLDEYGDFTSGRWGWLLAHVVKFPQPEPALGHLSLWNWDPVP
ncbi:MAG TPA: ASCH domain-containing protein [Candidatus Lokiarchaeia archaeon]|nr:ASCH domain-containing protein [Candidatus Lokiarchaeia archaeon]